MFGDGVGGVAQGAVVLEGVEDLVLFGLIFALGLGVEGGGEAVVLVLGVLDVAGEFVADGFGEGFLDLVEVVLRGLGLVAVEEAGDDVAVGGGKAAFAVGAELEVVVAEFGVAQALLFGLFFEFDLWFVRLRPDAPSSASRYCRL